MRQASAQASGGTESSASLMKDAQAASGFLQPPRTVPVSGVNLAPHAGHLRLRTPEGPNPSLQAGEAPHRGQGGGGRSISAASASVPEPVSSRSLRSSTASDRPSSLAGASGPTSPAQGVRVLHGGIVPSARTPTRRDCRQTKIRVGARAHSLFGTHKDSAALRAALSITYLGDC